MHLTDGGKEHWYRNKEVAQDSGCSAPNKLPKPDHLKQYSEPTGFIGIVSGDDMVIIRHSCSVLLNFNCCHVILSLSLSPTSHFLPPLRLITPGPPFPLFLHVPIHSLSLLLPCTSYPHSLPLVPHPTYNPLHSLALVNR